MAFIVILLVQFVLIIVDRALYLRRNVRGKLFFQLFQVLVVHIWLFLVLPGITRMYVNKEYFFAFFFFIAEKFNFFKKEIS